MSTPRSYLRRSLALAAGLLGLGAAALAQSPAVDAHPNPSQPAVEILIDIEGSNVTIGSAVANPTADSLQATCTLSVERLSATGNRSRSAQSSAVALASGGETTLGRSTVNFAPGDRLAVTAELHDAASGALLARSQVEREM